MAVSSLIVPLGTQAPSFTLPDTSGVMTGLDDFAAAPHCWSRSCATTVPMSATSRPCWARCPDLAVVGICTNDADAYPGDRPGELAGQAWRAGWAFPYLVDVGQAAGRAYHAACTPDFFLYDSARRLAYRGAFDQSTPGNGKPVTGELLRAAIELTWPASRCPSRTGPAWAAPSNGGPDCLHDQPSPSAGPAGPASPAACPDARAVSGSACLPGLGSGHSG